MNEIWKDVIGYEGIYQVSNTGRVVSLSRPSVMHNGGIKILPERLMTAKVNRGGYQVVHLRTGGNLYPTVHKLVAQAFLDNPDGKPTVNHIDGNKLNNHVDNLEWATHSEQMIHAISTGLYVQPDISKYTKRGESHPNSKLNPADIESIKLLRASGKTLKSIAEEFGIGISQVHRVCKGETWRHLNE